MDGERRHSDPFAVPQYRASLRAQLRDHQSPSIVEPSQAISYISASRDLLDLDFVREKDIDFCQGVDQIGGPGFGRIVSGIERGGQAGAVRRRKPILETGPK